MAKIMIVDHSTAAVEKLRDIVESLGHQMTAAAAAGQEAVDRYDQSEADIVFLDMDLPQQGMDGFEVIRGIRAKDPSAVIIMMSSLEDRNKVFEAMKLGAKHYLLKPLTKTRAAEVIGAALEDKRRSTESNKRGAAEEGWKLQGAYPSELPFELFQMDDRSVLIVRSPIQDNHLKAWHGCLQGLLYFRKLTCIVECWEPIHHETALRLLTDFVMLARAAKGSIAIVSEDAVFRSLLDAKLQSGVFRAYSEVTF